MTEGHYVESRTNYDAKQGDDGDQWHRAMKNKFKAARKIPVSTSTFSEAGPCDTPM